MDEGKTMTCNCRTCAKICRWREALLDETRRDDTFEEIMGDLETAETDAAYYQAILNGTWPCAEEILLLALKKIQDKKAAQVE